MAICEGQEELLHFKLKPRGKAERDILLENRSDKPIAISRVESSCDCLTLVTPLADLTFKPGERTNLRIAVKLSHNSKYNSGFAPVLPMIGPDEPELSISCGVDVYVNPKDGRK